MPLQLDPWFKAAECERAIEIVADPERRVILNSLRSVWVALGNKQSLFNGLGERPTLYYCPDPCRS